MYPEGLQSLKECIEQDINILNKILINNCGTNEDKKLVQDSILEF